MLFIFRQKRTLIALTCKNVLPKMWATLQHAIDVSQLFLSQRVLMVFYLVDTLSVAHGAYAWYQRKHSTCKWNLKLNLIRSLPGQTFIQLMKMLRAGTHSMRREAGGGGCRAVQGRHLCGQLTTQCMLRLRPAAPPVLLDCISRHWTKFCPTVLGGCVCAWVRVWVSVCVCVRRPFGDFI